MPAGLQTFTSNGALWFDMTERLCQVYTSFSTGTTSGSFTIPVGSGTPWLVTVADSNRVVIDQYRTVAIYPTPDLSYDPATRTVSWFFTGVNVGRQPLRVIVGYF
ncbi:hypothetical protein [Pseudomonas phage vB_PaeS_TUMS_P6]|nr:hypothetical protein [Pseudomonas phage vB_PaeS_TUMS_P6]